MHTDTFRYLQGFLYPESLEINPLSIILDRKIEDNYSKNQPITSLSVICMYIELKWDRDILQYGISTGKIISKQYGCPNLFILV